MRALALVAVVCAIAIACGGARSEKLPATAHMAPPPDPHAEIEALDRQIADDMARANVSQPRTRTCSGAACAEAMSQPFATPTTSEPQCRPAATERCQSACTISTSICNNQQRICDLAKQLAGDDWAVNKCESARASCRAANESCCSCVA